MDGYAVRSADCREAPARLLVVGEVAAGKVPERKVGPGEAMRIMTGAIVPERADGVVKVEWTRTLENDRVEVQEVVCPGDNIARKGEDLNIGDVALPASTFLAPAEIGLLASIGKSSVDVIGSPSVAVLATGTELVPAGEIPGPGEIRNSNGPGLMAAAEAAGGRPRDLGIGRDDPEELAAKVREGLNADILLVSGGVSMGRHDHTERILREAGVQFRFDCLAVKPGKPAVFGVCGSCRVFGLPGNPVSSQVIFELLVKPAIRRMRGLHRILPHRVEATVLGNARGDRKRQAFVRGNLKLEQGRFRFYPLESHGSGDLPGYTGGNALLDLPPGRTSIQPGETGSILFDELFSQR